MSRVIERGPAAKAAARAVLGIAVAGAVSGAAHAKDTVGWALADKPRAHVAYQPDPAHSFSSSGSKIIVTPVGTGNYRVDFRGLFTGTSLNNVQVTAYNTRGYCTSTGWDSEGDFHSTQMGIACFDRSGNLANTEFSVLYQARTGTFGDGSTGIAYLWADHPTTTDYTPNSYYNYNSSGAPNTIHRAGIGDYLVAIPGLVASGGDAQVTAYDSANLPARCKVGPEDWTPGVVTKTVHVQCFDSSGAPVDEYFSFAYTLNMPFSSISGTTTQGAYAWANQSKKGTFYTPPVPWNFNSVNGSDLTQVALSSRGIYGLELPTSITGTSSLLMVTGRKALTGNTYCNIFLATANVECFKQGGLLQDVEFDIAYESISPVP